jgi:peroxiredoxin
LPSEIEQVHREFRAQGLAVLAVDIREPRATVVDWVRTNRLTVPVVLDTDGQVSRQYEVTVTPTVFLVARDGTLVGKALGTKPWTSPAGRALLRALSAS